MPSYRHYCTDGRGRFTARDDFDADDDEAAIGYVQRLRHPHDCEIWAGSRLVTVVKGTGTPDPSPRAA